MPTWSAARTIASRGPPVAIFAFSSAMRSVTNLRCKALVREQYFMLLIDQEAALTALPALLPDDIDDRRRMFAGLQELVSARGEFTNEVVLRLQRIARLFGMDANVTAEGRMTLMPKAS